MCAGALNVFPAGLEFDPDPDALVVFDEDCGIKFADDAARLVAVEDSCAMLLLVLFALEIPADVPLEFCCCCCPPPLGFGTGTKRYGLDIPAT